MCLPFLEAVTPPTWGHVSKEKAQGRVKRGREAPEWVSRGGASQNEDKTFSGRFPTHEETGVEQTRTGLGLLMRARTDCENCLLARRRRLRRRRTNGKFMTRTFFFFSAAIKGRQGAMSVVHRTSAVTRRISHGRFRGEEPKAECSTCQSQGGR